MSSKRQSGHHRRSGRFVVKDPLDLAHYARVQFWDKLKACDRFKSLAAVLILFYRVPFNGPRAIVSRSYQFSEIRSQHAIVRKIQQKIARTKKKQEEHFARKTPAGSLPANFGDSRTIDLYWMHRAEGTEHFHSLETTRWPVARKNIPVFRPEHTRPAICPSISESPRQRTCPSTRTPGAEVNITSKASARSHTEGVRGVSRLVLLQ